MLPVSRPLSRSPGIGSPPLMPPGARPQLPPQARRQHQYSSSTSSLAASSSNGSVVRLNSDLVRDTQLHCEWPGTGLTSHQVYDTAPQARRRVLRSQIWRRQRRLGGGTYGNVWLEKCVEGDDERVKGKVRAVKEIAKDTLGDSHFEYHRELEAIAKFSHRKYRHRFVRSFGWYESQQAVFIAMEYALHGDLQSYMQFPLPESETCDIVSQVLDGLCFMHDNGFTHRDLKPGNILVFEQAPDWWVKITDFGITKRSQQEDGTAMRTVVGTRGYQAPEILGFFVEGAPPAGDGEQDNFTYTSSVDIWALGEITFRLFTCKPAFQPRTLFDYVTKGAPFPDAELERGQASPELCEFIRLTMAADPAARPSSRAALAMPWLVNAAALAEGSPAQSSVMLTPSISVEPSNLSLDDVASARWSTVSHATAVNHSPSPGQSPRMDFEEPTLGSPYPAPALLPSMPLRREETAATDASTSSWPRIDTPLDSFPPQEQLIPAFPITPSPDVPEQFVEQRKPRPPIIPPDLPPDFHKQFMEQGRPKPPIPLPEVPKTKTVEQPRSRSPIPPPPGFELMNAEFERLKRSKLPVVAAPAPQTHDDEEGDNSSYATAPSVVPPKNSAPIVQDFAVQSTYAPPLAPLPELPRTEHPDPVPPPPFSITFTPITCACERCALRPCLSFHPRTCVMPGQTGRVSARRHSDQFPPVTEGAAQDLYFKTKVVSREHCRFTLEGGNWYLQDTKSSSGTFLNGIRLSRENRTSSRRLLSDGDVVQLGVRYTKFEGEDTSLMWPARMVVNLNGGQASKWAHHMLVLRAGPATDEDGPAAEAEGKAEAPVDGNSTNRNSADGSGSDEYASPDDNRRRRRNERRERANSSPLDDGEAGRAKPKDNVFKRLLRIIPSTEGRSEARYV